MAEIIKTWPAVVGAKTTARMLSPDKPAFHTYYFTLGMGRPREAVDRLWFTYLGRIVGYFPIDEIIVNDGTLPRLSRLDGGESDWQFRKDARIAVCRPPCVRLKERVYMAGFRGWRYFDLATYRELPESRHRW